MFWTINSNVGWDRVTFKTLDYCQTTRVFTFMIKYSAYGLNENDDLCAQVVFRKNRIRTSVQQCLDFIGSINRWLADHRPFENYFGGNDTEGVRIVVKRGNRLISSDEKPILSVGLVSARLETSFYFVVDQTCFVLMKDELLSVLHNYGALNRSFKET